MPKGKTHEQFIKEVALLFRDEYTVVGTYRNTRTKIVIKHNSCGKEWSTNPNQFLLGHGCPYCKVNSKKTQEQFMKDVRIAVGDEYSVLSRYRGNKIKVKMKHNVCGYEWEVTPAHFLAKSNPTRCPVCQRAKIDRERMKTHDEFIKQVYNLVKDEYTFLDHYKGTETNIKVKHNECGNTYEVRPANFLYGLRCPHCNKSKGEQRIKNYLHNNNFSFKTQYSFRDCRGKRKPLLFDFALFNKEALLALIEYDGGQHYKPIEHFGGEKNFEIRMKYDNIKNHYCKSHNIQLIRIPYTVKNIEGYLEGEILKLNKPIQLALII